MLLSTKGLQMRPLVKMIYTHRAEQSPGVGQKSIEQMLLYEEKMSQTLESHIET